MIAGKNTVVECLSSFSTITVRLVHRIVHFGSLTQANFLLDYVRTTITKSLNFLSRTTRKIFSKVRLQKMKFEKFIFAKKIDYFLHGPSASHTDFDSRLQAKVRSLILYIPIKKLRFVLGENRGQKSTFRQKFHFCPSSCGRILQDSKLRLIRQLDSNKMYLCSKFQLCIIF